MRYIIFEKSAVERLVNEEYLQSYDYELSQHFIRFLKRETDEISLKKICVRTNEDGIFFCGEKVEKTFLMIDMEQCGMFEKSTDVEVLIVMQKLFRFAIRFWTHQNYTKSEIMQKDKTVLFPFSYSAKAGYRVLIQRNATHKRFEGRGIKQCLFAYKYGDDDSRSAADETPNDSVLRKGGEAFHDLISEFGREFASMTPLNGTFSEAIHVVEAENMISNSEFKYMQYEKQLEKLTISQRKIVECEDMTSPIRVEGPAGTGKTAALILRAIKLLKDAKEDNRDISIAFLVHSKSTEEAVKQTFYNIIDESWFDQKNRQSIFVTTLQEYCVNYANIQGAQVIDLDASEAKQYQLFMIGDAYTSTCGNVFNTYKPLMSEQAIEFFESEAENKIVLMLQYEFSIRIKGIAEGNLEQYKSLAPLANGLPLLKEGDKEYVFRIYKEYQNSLELSSVYDTDDIIMEAIGRLNGPIWRRTRANKGVDYLFVDEMHLFNLNEQHVFHYLTKFGEQENIPICFALDYAQIIGERNDLRENYIEQTLAKGQVLKQEFATVFRSSRQIAELCASITASGTLLFNQFINPYKYCEINFIAKEEEKCGKPQLIMYENDEEMSKALCGHIKELINLYKCRASDIALVFFDEDMLNDCFTESVGAYKVNFINGRNGIGNKFPENEIICTTPEYTNGLEFKCVVLVGVDEERVPQKGISDVSANFLMYTALNKLYLVCSRAQYSVTMLGTKVRGISQCLNHSLSNDTLELLEK